MNKKKIKKSIISIKKQIEIHEKKKEEAEKEGDIELNEYYKKEIDGLKDALERKEKKLK